ncbi:hypothetical protein [Streptomyces sp. NPDC059168]|uniref:VHL beta domain-containing protein n=1 Tax=Streptomyces sp. NPDC059168 TaxID=3346753 RepID=UPI0036AF652D
MPASEVDGLRSEKGEDSTYIEFVNTSGMRLNVYWIDYEKKRVLYQVLESGCSYVQQTFVTHPWLAVTDSGAVRAAYLPSSSPARAVIR